MNEIVIDGQRLLDELFTLANFTERVPSSEFAGSTSSLTDGIPDVAVTRIVFTQQDRQARVWLANLAAEAGLSPRVDAVGNTFLRWAGTEPELPAIATGSHIDAIPNAGMYDGTVGVLGGLEAIRALQHAGFQPTRSIELILFTSEEPTRFGIGCLGSRLLSGTLSAPQAATLPDALHPGQTLTDALQSAGIAGDLASVQLGPGHYRAFIELHIEQGPLLEGLGVPIGLVSAIAAPASARIVVQGEGGHAGAMLMPRRRDALAAAAEIILVVEAAALATGAEDTVATVGICEVFPGAMNSVPSRVHLTLDVRDIALERRDSVLDEIRHGCSRIATERKVRISFEMLNADPPAMCDPRLLEAAAQACAHEGIAHERLVSRAYHDSLFMAQICPVAMLFVPSRAGVSHRPDEFSSAAAIATGTRILAQTLATLSRT